MFSVWINRIFSRTFLFIILCVIGVAWLLFGNSALGELSDENSKIKKYVARQIEQLTEANSG